MTWDETKRAIIIVIFKWKTIGLGQELLQSNDIAQDVSLTFIHDSHDRALANQLKDEVIDLMIFNLGYLPGE